MDSTYKIALSILALIIMVVGIAVTYGAKAIVKKYKMDEKVKFENNGRFTEEEEIKNRHESAVLKVKMIGAGICLPGALLLFLVAR
jgi:hypothetical protein